MKKLMIAAAIVCAAAFAQASTFTWAAMGIVEKGENVSGVAYLFSGSYTVDGIIEALAGVGADDAKTYINGITKKYTTAADDGTMTDGATKPNTSLVNLVDGGGKQPLFAVIFDTDTITDDSNFIVAKAERTVPANGNAAFSYGDLSESTWNAVSVPEPTSGLLLLLGVAGLALRRRRA